MSIWLNISSGGEKERERDSEMRERERERERERGAIWLDAHHFRIRYFLFITQLILCDKVTTVYCSMLASGWLVLGGAGGGGVCHVFLFSYFRFINIFLIFISFVSFLSKRVWREEDEWPRMRVSYAKARRYRNREGTCSDVYASILSTSWIQKVAYRSVPVKITVIYWKRYNLSEFIF